MKYQAYPAYKESGVEWLGEVPEHWDVKRIKYISTCNDDLIAESTAPDCAIEYVEISGITENIGITETTIISFSEAPSRAKRRVKHGDIIISTVRTYLRAISSINYPPENMVVSTGFAVIRPRNVNSGFIGYLFHAEFLIANVIAHSAGISYPAINASELIKLQVPFPSFQEQIEITKFLDSETQRIDALVEEKNRFIELLKEKRQTLISHVVIKGLDPTVKMKDSGVDWLGEVPEHWAVTKLGFITSKIGSGKTPNGGAEVYTEQGVIFIRSQNVYDAGLVLEDVAYINEEIDASMSGTRVKSGDILLNVTGASIGRTCLVPKDFPDANVNQHVCIIRLKAEKNKDYVSWCLKSNSSKMLINVYQNGAGREGLNFEQISNITLAMPLGSHEIDKIVAYLDNQTTKIDTLITETQQSIALLKEHRTALISAAVTGKIDVREAA